MVFIIGLLVSLTEATTLVVGGGVEVQEDETAEETAAAAAEEEEVVVEEAEEQEEEDEGCFLKALSVEVVVISLAFCSKLAKSLLVSGCGKLLKEKVGKVVDGKEVTWG